MGIHDFAADGDVSSVRRAASMSYRTTGVAPGSSVVRGMAARPFR